MIGIYIEDIKYRHDVFELVRVFYPDKKICFLDKIVKNTKYSLVLIIKNNGYLRYTTYLLDKKLNLIDINKEFDLNYLNSKEYTYKYKKWNIIKRGIYKILSKNTSRYVPWGILTGIRPMKLMHKLNRSYTKEKVYKIFHEEYMIKTEKIDLMYSIYLRQEPYIKSIRRNNYNLYISIPFCPSICSYCSFGSYKINKNTQILEKYVKVLIYELEKTLEIMKDYRLNTVYIGGGTPSILEIKDMEKIIKTIIDKIEIEDIKEFTVEVGRPDTINKDYLYSLKNLGVNRISINPQTMNNKTLKKVKRTHTKESIIYSYYLAKEMGFDIINMDIILGLPGEDEKDIENTLIDISKLKPDNLTIHSLSMKRGSNLKNNEYNNTCNNINQINKIKKIIRLYINELGLEPYYLYRQKETFGNLENIGYAKKGKESIYNILMMEEKETVIGIGAGSVSKIYFDDGKIKRLPNLKGVKDYIDRVNEMLNNKRQLINKI